MAATLPLSFTLRTAEDPSAVLDWLQQYAVEMAQQLDGHRHHHEDAIAESCCVADAPTPDEGD